MTEIKIIKGDILTVDSGLLIHGVNCQGKFNLGIAKQIRIMYPVAYVAYMEQFSDNDHGKFFHKRNLLGKICKVPVTESLSIVHAFSQQYYGNDGKKYVSYDAVDSIFQKLSECVEPTAYIHFPKIGCGLAGGEWSVVQSIIEHRLKDFPNKFLWIKE